MESNTLPHSAISNLCWPVLVVLTTVFTMRVRNSLCSKQPRLRTQYAVEMQQVVFTCMLAFASIVIWSTALQLDMMQLVTIDMIVGHASERWLLRIMRAVDPQTYHPGAAIGRIAINQRLRYSLLVCTLVRGYCAALTAAVANDSNWYELEPEWYYAVMPVVYSAYRTCVVDVQMYDQSVMHVRVHDQDDPVCVAQSDFTIANVSDEEQETDSTTAL